MCLTSVCLSRASGLSREERGLRRPKLVEVAHVTRDSDTNFKVKRSKAALLTAVLARQAAAARTERERERERYTEKRPAGRTVDVCWTRAGIMETASQWLAQASSVAMLFGRLCCADGERLIAHYSYR